ncbi:39-S ribosomal protein L47 (macronuclear) [Tetrahymena thermophila SB210]|uniref:Large ribosomal subunit protein uL29m n=1 Tax=Tetrahymena thermophila (strain SB210) TaxID=312017 RepID=Q22W36_TETTS|nr:39-S ribosomal protein L47 [Tetrahymena thermophila SB210]EAR89581.2 39-S ribosomal protein L47 [Tetrahymena thermophila SB210]6Z1P_AC Chain AC, 39-S ribosomal protein L47 [Tetrahymena thermophila SB210]|eukprot:XP_001009826.2 39-S ribosomal protein L47 [Tetrahymena thermophila SB210]
MNFLFRQTFNSIKTSFQATRSNTQLAAFTDLLNKKQADEKNQKVASGRAWYAAELRFKSNEELHKLWYVLLREKNALKSDNQYKFKVYDKIGQQGRLGKVKRSMARLLTVVNERKQIRENYRKHLEEEYVAKQREQYEKLLQEEQEKNKYQAYVPELTQKVLRAKYRDLKRGIDNTDYIKQAAEIEQSRAQLKQELEEKYDYKNKKLVDANQEVEDENSVIRSFSSGFLKQLEEGRVKISQEEVLRSHVKNWKMLNMKQRRVVLNFINARRARDAKSEFLKELNVFAQKVAHDNLLSRITKESTGKI